MYLNDEQLKDAIISYIFDHEQAILINGDWGSGKTYFIKYGLTPALNKKINEKKKESDEKKPQVAYLSLYGVSSLDDIKNAIYMSFIENLCDKGVLKNKGSQIIKGAKLVSKVILPHLDINKEIIDSVEVIIKEYSENSSFVIIFDDIERCDIEVNQLLGYINDLVEHSSVKAILVGNEKEFSTHKMQQDLPQKFNTVLNKRIDWRREANEKSKDNGKDTLTKEQLIEYTGELFSSDAVYQKIKEKLIGLTVQFNPNFDKAYSSICNKYIKDGPAKEFLVNKIEYVLNIFNNRKHLNLRTLIFVLISFEKIYQVDIVNECEYDKDSVDEIRIKILKYVAELGIKIKTGQSLPVWKNSTEITQSIYLTNIGIWEDSIIGYQFVDIYLRTGYLNSEMCQETTTKYLDEVKQQRAKEAENLELSKLSYNKMYQWWKLEDRDVLELLKTIVSELGEMKYPPMYFKEILVIWFQLTFNNFKDIPCVEKFISPMKTYIENEKVDNLKFIEIWTDDISFKTSYDKAVSTLREAIEVNVSSSQQTEYDVNICFEESFLDWCSKEYDNFLQKRQFISLFKVTDIINKLKESKTAKIYNFLDGINSVYRFSNLNDFFKSDLQTIVQILDYLNGEDFSSDSNTKSIAIKKVKEKLEDVKTILEK
ncbi:MAG: hypothetical protein RR063_09460 [Anaerovoracaceae bacterium]